MRASPQTQPRSEREGFLGKCGPFISNHGGVGGCRLAFAPAGCCSLTRDRLQVHLVSANSIPGLSLTLQKVKVCFKEILLSHCPIYPRYSRSSLQVIFRELGLLDPCLGDSHSWAAAFDSVSPSVSREMPFSVCMFWLLP